MLCPYNYVMLRTGLIQKIMKRLDMTERLLTDEETISADKKDISTLFEHNHFKNPIMPSTHIKEFDKQCRSNVETRQIVNEIMSDKGLHCLL